MTVEVYFWSPKPATLTSPKPPSVGHAALMVDGGEPGGKIYLSAWPGNPLSVLGSTAEYQDHMSDLIAENRQPEVVRLRRLNETAIKKAIKQIQAMGLYSFPGHNCAHQAYSCLRAGVPATLGGFLSDVARSAGAAALGGVAAYVAGPGVSTPWGLFGYARSLVSEYG